MVEKKRVLFRFVGTAFVGGFRFPPVLVEGYLKMRVGTSRNAVMQLPNPNKYVLAKENVVMVILNFPFFFYQRVVWVVTSLPSY